MSTEEKFSDEEKLYTHYHELKFEAHYGPVSNIIAQIASFREAEAHMKILRHWFPVLRSAVPVLFFREAAEMFRLNHLERMLVLREILSSCYKYSLTS